MERRNVNRGFRQLRVWQDAVDLYVLSFNLLKGFPYELKRTSSNAVDAANSISRNIAEGYCRKSIKEYLIHLNFALGSCGELYSCMESFRRAEQIDNDAFEKFDELHYKVENQLLGLIKSLHKKKNEGNWEDTL